MNFLDEKIPARLWKFMTPCPMTGCWLWTGRHDRQGYARIPIGGISKAVHRITYVLAKGQPAKGLELDHRCRVRGCVNPVHLEPVTHRENLLRGSTFAARNASATSCPKGHPYDEANTYRATDGSRACRTCHRDHAARRLISNRDAINARRRELARQKRNTNTVQDVLLVQDEQAHGSEIVDAVVAFTRASVA